MKLTFLPLNPEHALAILDWQYAAPYDIYNFNPPARAADLRYLLDPANAFFAILCQSEELLGFCSFGPDGQVPGGNYGSEALDIGMGIRPDLIGQGRGKHYARAVLNFGMDRYRRQPFRVTVAEFNQRAQRVWQQLGFTQTEKFFKTGSPEPFIIMARQASNPISTSSIPASWFNRASPAVAEDLLGCILIRKIGREIARGQIVETEAYEAGDPAMYAYQRKTERNAVVFGPAGVAYIYRIYRQYHCFNIVTDREGFASTILIRAIQLAQHPSWVAPKKEKLARIAAGPGKLCRVLQLDESLRGTPIQPDSGLWVEPRPDGSTSQIVQTTRIGLSRGADRPWRWYLADSPAVSKKAQKQ